MTGLSSADPRPAWRAPLVLFAAGCLVAGTFARFWGLGTWPLAIDEYYFAQSVQNLLHFGIPQFPCGGLYIRGLLLQYAAAALQWLGLSAELAPRLLAALTSLLALPPIYKIARRLGGQETALLATAFLGLSVWEVEMGRFGRMYAPFQALFAWYVLFFLQYVVDRDRRARLPLLILSALGLAVWEGGIFLVITNLLPPFIAHPDGRLTRRDWWYLAGCSLLLIPAYVLTMADLRIGSEPAFPAGYEEPPDMPSQSRLDAAIMPWTTLLSHTGWVIGALAPAASLLYAAIHQLRSRQMLPAKPLSGLALLAVLGCAALQQFQLVAGILVVCVLLGVLDGRDLRSPAFRPLHVAIIACVLFWVAFGLATDDWHARGLSLVHKALLLGYEFVRFPDTVRQVAMPWARTVPHLALGLFVLVGTACLRACWRPDDTSLAERVLLALLIILLLAAGASDTPRHETRYVFFLYPFAVVFSILTIRRLVCATLGETRIAAGLGTLLCIAAFMSSEDFSPHHLWNIDTEEINFRIGMSGRMAGHFHPRSDVRAAAEWLRSHVVPGEDIVINSFPGVDFYYRGADFYFVAETDARFAAWSCSRGTVQRWSNLPMIRSYDGLAAKVATGRRIWMILETAAMPQILTKFPPSDWTVAWTAREHDITIVSIHSVGKQQAATVPEHPLNF